VGGSHKHDYVCLGVGGRARAFDSLSEILDDVLVTDWAHVQRMHRVHLIVVLVLAPAVRRTETTTVVLVALVVVVVVVIVVVGIFLPVVVLSVAGMVVGRRACVARGTARVVSKRILGRVGVAIGGAVAEHGVVKRLDPDLLLVKVAHDRVVPVVDVEQLRLQGYGRAFEQVRVVPLELELELGLLGAVATGLGTLLERLDDCEGGGIADHKRAQDETKDDKGQSSVQEDRAVDLSKRDKKKRS